MCAILLKAAIKHIGLNVVGMAGRCCVTKQINDKLKGREEACRSEGIYNKAHKSLNEDFSQLTTEEK